MGLIKKIFLFSCIVLCIVLLLVSCIGFYLYYHPGRIKPIVERSLAASTGASCTIENLSYSLHPMVIEAGGILLEHLKPRKIYSVKIPFIRADMDIQGPWGHRTLVIKNMRIDGLYLDVFPQGLEISGILPEKRGSSFTAAMTRGIIGLFFFRNIRFHSGELLDGQISAAMDDQTFQARRIHANISADKPLLLSFACEIENSSRHMHFSAPEVKISGSTTFDISDFRFTGTLDSPNMGIKDPDFGIRKINVRSKFTYSHGPKIIDVENLKTDCQGIALGDGLKKTGSMPVPVTSAESLSVKTGFTCNLKQKKIVLSPLAFHITGMSVTKNTGTLPSPLNIDFKAKEISGKYPVIEIKDATILVPKVKINTNIRGPLTTDIRMQLANGRMDAEKISLNLPEVRLEAFGLKNLYLGIRLRERSLSLTVQGKQTSLFRAAAAYRLIPSDWDIKGQDVIQIDVSGPRAGPWQVHTKLSLDDLIFQNRIGNIMGEKVSLHTNIQGDVNLKDSRMTFSAEINAQTGEALYDRFYVDLGKNPVALSCNGSYDLRKKVMKLPVLRFDLKGILPVDIRGLFKKGASKTDADVTVVLPKTPLKPIFHHFLQEPYKTEKPFLETLEAMGTVSAQFRINRFQDAWQVLGRFKWLDGKFSLPSKGIAIKGIGLDLPVWYRTGASQPAAKTLNGKLEVQSIAIPLLPEQPLSILVDTGPNRISVESPTEIQVPGGKVRLGPVQAEKLFGPDLAIHTRLKFDDIRLQPILSKIWTHPIKGTLFGSLNPIRYENHVVTTQGELKAHVFDGRITLSDLGTSGVFTSAPVYTFNVKWEDLLLSEMTTGTEFGTIEGVLEGGVRDVEIAYGQPQRFNLLLETVKKKGVPQKISVKAVENIAQIGGGQSPFMGLAGTFASFFKKFPYEKIGIRASLENDEFTVNGTIKEGGTEYLIKRGSFSGVNIVNQNPDNRISFKDMVKRIKRISSGGGPIVK